MERCKEQQPHCPPMGGTQEPRNPGTQDGELHYSLPHTPGVDGGSDLALSAG